MAHTDAIVRYVQARPGTTFVELERLLSDLGMEVKGDLLIDVRPNVIMWANMSQEFVDEILALQSDGRVVPAHTDTTAFCYMVDGKVLNLPVAVRPPKNGYKEPHWAPTAFFMRDATVEA